MHIMRKILITWGAWFIGSHLCKNLLSEGNEIICLDNLFTGNKSNIYDLQNHPKFTFVLHDVTQPFWSQVDEIYNLACPASPIHYQKNPVETAKTSVMWMINMLELATKTGAKILQASTSEVYGDPHQHPQTESYRGNVNPIGPRSCYDEGKRMAETLCIDYQKQFWTKIKIVRIFNTYGPNMHPNDWRVISNFIMQALQNKEITIYWKWNQTRSFQYIDDLIKGLTMMMNSNEAIIGPINLWTEFEFTIKELANKILELIPNSKSKIIYQNLPIDDPQQRRSDNNLVEKQLWRKPQTRLEDWLKKTIAYFSTIIKNNNYFNHKD